MTERWSTKDYNDYLLTKCPAPKTTRSTKQKQKRDLALLLLINRLGSECGIIDSGTWKRGMEVNRNTLYREFPGITGRKFRFDLACPSLLIALEIQGGGPGMAHHSIKGRQRDMEKSRLSQLEGWLYIEASWREVADGTAFDLIKRALKVREDAQGT